MPVLEQTGENVEKNKTYDIHILLGVAVLDGNLGGQAAQTFYEKNANCRLFRDYGNQYISNASQLLNKKKTRVLNRRKRNTLVLKQTPSRTS